jgi:hypothetical protein
LPEIKEAAKILNINDLYKIILTNYIRLGTGYEWTGKLVCRRGRSESLKGLPGGLGFG